MNQFKCTLITPQGSFFDGLANSISAPGLEGRFEVLAGHEHILTILKPGIVKITDDNSENYFAIDCGVFEVDGNHSAVILADKAIKAQNEEDAYQKIKDIEKPPA